MTTHATRITISSNCQTPGLLAALRGLLPMLDFCPLPVGTIRRFRDPAQVLRELRHTSIWIYTSAHRVIDLATVRSALPDVRVLEIPRIRFWAFHPDVCYARNGEAGELTRPHYNSSIAVWAYNHGLSAAQAARLFADDVYAELGFCNRWDDDVDALQREFEAGALDFRPFYLSVKRQGVFMHTPNHPKPFVIARLAQIVAARLTGDPSMLERGVSIGDDLLDQMWPVYPGVASSLAIEHGPLDWKVDGRWQIGLDAYLEAAFEGYARQRIRRGDLRVVPGPDMAHYERVLAPRAGRRR
jgi:hypothetical protein